MGNTEHILVTGGSGRLGRSVVQGLLSAGHAVTSVDQRLPEAPELGAEYLSVDLLDTEKTLEAFASVRPDAVISLAAIAVPFSAPEAVILKTNATIAHNVASAALESGCKKIVLASSPTVIGYGAPAGWLPERFPLDEMTPTLPWHAYGLSKLVAEQVASMFAAARGNEARFASFRPCYVIAPEEWEGAPTQQGHTVTERLQDPDLAAPSLFNYVDARDVTDFLLLLLEKMDSIGNGSTFFVGAADALATRPLSELLPRYVPGSEDLAAVLSGTSSAFSIDRARTVLGWEPKRSWRTELLNQPDPGLGA